MNPAGASPQGLHKIVSVDRLEGALLVAFDNGQEFICPANALYELLPREFEIVEQPDGLDNEQFSD